MHFVSSQQRIGEKFAFWREKEIFEVQVADGRRGPALARWSAKLKGYETTQGSSSSPVVQSVRIFGFHPEDPGSIPGRGAIFAFCDFLRLIADMIIIAFGRARERSEACDSEPFSRNAFWS